MECCNKSINDFRSAILEYLNAEKEYYEEDIRNNKALSDTEKIAAGLLIQEARIKEHTSKDYVLSVSENNTKLRPGDKLTLCIAGTKKCYEALVIENGDDEIMLESLIELPGDAVYRIEVNEYVLLDPLIKLAESIQEGGPGSFWLAMMAGCERPDMVGLGRIPLCKVNTFPESLNKQQRRVCELMLNRPSFYCLQGPPGTGKTDVLATLANTFSSQGKEVLIISNTHQAVNNALNKLQKVNSHLLIIKVGEEMKAAELHHGIVIASTYNEYLTILKAKGNKQVCNDVVGMTFQAAVVNLGLRHSGFKPSIILVDEAGQMPMVHGALIGTFGSGSVLFIGDDRQMPPIFHEKLVGHLFSKSIFTYLTEMYRDFRDVLTVTYRMNQEITEFCNCNFYRPYGIELSSSAYSKNRYLSVPANSEDKRINHILSAETPMLRLDVSQREDWEDDNMEEALFIADLVKEAMKDGCPYTDLAVITPYRRQVKAIRQCVIDALGINDGIPLIDTVERLQGQDVDMIIISLCATEPDFFRKQQSFILNKNRLNVMISRAKKKVLILGKYGIGINDLNFPSITLKDDDHEQKMSD